MSESPPDEVPMEAFLAPPGVGIVFSSPLPEQQVETFEEAEKLPDGFARFDPADLMLDCNERFMELFSSNGSGVEPGMSFSDILKVFISRPTWKLPEKLTRAWLSSRVHEHQNPVGPVIIDRGDGMLLRCSEHKLADGSIVGIYSDISHLIRREQDLFEAKEAAETASKTKSDFLATVSHELRTPLNIIIGFSEMIQNQLLGPIENQHYMEYVRDINQSGTHLLELINDILDLSKAEAGKIELNNEIVEVPALIESGLRMIRERAHAAELDLVSDVSPRVSCVLADRRRMLQVLLNLLSNAVKFTPAGGSITIVADSNDDGITIKVIDSGIGIAPEDIPKALRPFGQIDSSLSRKYQGTGLGLSLTKRLMEIHGGSLRIDSVVGKGTTVSVHLPRERLVANAAAG
ncbi:MAG TPA: hypothetical protein DCW68_05475 [Rhodospirillaceae bacterium]|nr:MAG: hypothetical protein A2018_02175 [Alphaproteobacteria bacterium GWF2_58_20]HAU29546.1 hypothetical protein [Rhodospirillaceae bacterium]